MAMGPTRWKVVTPSEFPWEQEAFDFIRAQLPDADPYLAWQGFNFIADNGSIYEIDLLILTPVGFFLVEVKSQPGTLGGDAGTWTWKHEGRLRSTDNPLILANSKAKKLIGLLKAQKAFKELRCPYLEALIFCSAPGLQVDLPEHARKRVCVRDREASEGRDGRSGIIAALTRGCIEGVDASRPPRIDRAAMAAVGRAMEQAGIRQSERYRVISDYRLKSLLMEGPGWQDWEGVHVSLPDNRRRIRRYTVASAASDEQRATLLRAARREYQILDNLNHPGILGVKGFTDNEFGPAIIFEHHTKAVRLDLYLAEASGRSGIEVRLGLLRQIAEAMKHAHGKGIHHRSLSPQSVLIVDPNPKAGIPQTKIFNWQTASKELSGGSGTTGKAVTATVHLEDLVEDTATVYMAPEAMLEHEGGGEHLDVFSLGALAYHLFSGRPPASSFFELNQRIRESRGLQISAVVDGAPSSLQELVQYATHPEVTSRISSVDEFLEYLEEVEDELTSPTAGDTVHPLEAKPKDKLDGGLVVKSRLGSGSTSVALLVDDPQSGRECVLKIARSTEYSNRLKEEAEVLQKLRHQFIVEVYRTVQIHGLTGILMQRAGTKTLSQRIRDEGRLHPDLLQRFGEDLLVTADWLEQKGIPHRDIKPDNIGVMPVGRGDQLHLVLFDFSLSRTPPENIRAGTVRYLDPFLSLRKPPRWDLAAERYAAAVTLYEMATGDLPRWGDGRTDPAMLSCEATIDGERFDPEVREGLVAFFTTALRSDPTKRFDNCRDMLEAWRKAFQDVRPGTTTDDELPAGVDIDEAIAAATLDTHVASLGLMTRAVTALDRLNIGTVRELLGVPLRRIYRMRGVGNKTRRHLADAVTKLRAKFPEVESSVTSETSTTTEGGEQAATVWSVDRLVQTLTGGRPATKADAELKGIRSFLNLEKPTTPALGYWPTQTDIAKDLSVHKVKLSQWIDQARKRWQKNSSLTAVRNELLEILDGSGGVMSAEELGRALLATRGSNLADEEQRFRMASAVVRAAVETERGMVQPRLAVRRRGDVVLVAKVYDEEDPTALCDHAVKLGDEADKLAAAEPLPTPQRVIESLRRIKVPERAPYLTDNRLVALAAAASQTAAVSSRLEVYPRGMAAGRAMKLALGALAGAKQLTLDQIRERVHGRYPDAEQLPGRPELDRLIREAGWPFRWDAGEAAYLPAHVVLTTTSSSTTLPRYSTTSESPLTATPGSAEASEFEERLARSLKSGGFLALSVAPRHVRRAAADLADRFELDVKSLDELLIRELQKQAAARKVDWGMVLKADAEGPKGRDWAKLVTLVKPAVEQVERQLLAHQRPVLLMYPGLVARYEQLQFLEHLRDGTGRNGNVPGVWLLVASDHQSTLPTIDGRPVPVLGHGQWSWVPDAWLTNEHRGRWKMAAAESATADVKG